MAFDRDAPAYRCGICCCCSVHAKTFTTIVAVIDSVLLGLNIIVTLPIILATAISGNGFYVAVGNLAWLVLPALALLLAICALRRESHRLLFPFLLIQALVILILLFVLGYLAMIAAEGFVYHDSHDGFSGLGLNGTARLSDLNDEERKHFMKQESKRTWSLVLGGLGSAGGAAVLVLTLIQIWIFVCVLRCFRCFRDQAAAQNGGQDGGEAVGATYAAVPPTAHQPPPPYEDSRAVLYPEMKEIQ